MDDTRMQMPYLEYENNKFYMKFHNQLIFIYKAWIVFQIAWAFIKKIFRNPLFFILFIPLSYIVIWKLSHFISFNLFTYSRNLYEFLNLPGDISTDIKILKKLTSILTVALPLSLTFFYFSYREQKALAISSVSFWNNWTLLFGYFSTISLLLGIHLCVIMSPSNSFHGLFGIWVIFFLVATYTGVYSIKTHISNLTLKSQFSFAFNKIEKNLSLLEPAYFKSHKESIMQKIFSNIDVIYQLIFLAIDKNTVDFYNNSIEAWDGFLSKFCEDEKSNRRKFGDSEFGYVTYSNLRRTILKNQANLISKLLISNKLEDAQYAMRAFVSFESKSSEYYTALHELAVVFYKQDHLNIILDHLSIIAAKHNDHNKTINNIYQVYKQLIVLSIEKNDVKSISKISYSMLNNIKPQEQLSKKGGRIPTPYVIRFQQTDYLDECLLYMMFQTLLKSIELSYYSITGFLVKFIVSNFNGMLVKKVYWEAIDKLIKLQKGENPYLEGNKLSNISVSFYFNSTSIRYCMEKMSILLFCQQKYIKKYRMILDTKINVDPILDISGIKFDQEYLFHKITNVGDKYGLLFLNDQSFLNEVSSEMLKNKHSK